jgi:hypothetical protein
LFSIPFIISYYFSILTSGIYSVATVVAVFPGLRQGKAPTLFVRLR